MNNLETKLVLKTKFLNRPAVLCSVLGLFSIMIFSALVPYSFAESIVMTTIDDDTTLEKTTAIMHVPQDNVLPWGTVSGTITNPAYGYPVIIQFFESENQEIPVHVAQVDVKSDDTYEYKFRVRDVNLDTGIATNIFEGNYVVKIFKVVTPEAEPTNYL